MLAANDELGTQYQWRHQHHFIATARTGVPSSAQVSSNGNHGTRLFDRAAPKRCRPLATGFLAWLDPLPLATGSFHCIELRDGISPRPMAELQPPIWAEAHWKTNQYKIAPKAAEPNEQLGIEASVLIVAQYVCAPRTKGSPLLTLSICLPLSLFS